MELQLVELHQLLAALWMNNVAQVHFFRILQGRIVLQFLQFLSYLLRLLFLL